MTDLRKSILQNLLYLKRNWFDFLQAQYPNASLHYLKYNTFVGLVTRHRVQKYVMCSNGQDLEKICVNEVHKETLQKFLDTLPEDSWIVAENSEDYEGYPEIILSAFEYRMENDFEYNTRLLEMCKTLYEGRYKKTRSNDPELNKYIEYLEAKVGVTNAA